MREFPGAQSSVQRQKAQLVNFISEDATEKEAVIIFHWTTSPKYPKHMVHLLSYGLVSLEWSI